MFEPKRLNMTTLASVACGCTCNPRTIFVFDQGRRDIGYILIMIMKT